jgi:hypothetical protein
MGACPKSWIGIPKGWEETGFPPEDMLIELTPEHMAYGTCFIGGTGSGKTSGMEHLFAQAVARGESVISISELGDFNDTAANLLVAMGVDGDRIAMIDFRSGEWTLGCNPLDPDEPYFSALNFLRIMKAISESWGVTVEETSRFAWMLLAEAGRNILEIERLFFDDAFRMNCLKQSRNPSVKAFWRRYEQNSARSRQEMVGPVLNKYSVLSATEQLRRIYGHPEPIDIRRHIDTPGSVLLITLAKNEQFLAADISGAVLIGNIARAIFSRVGQEHRTRTRIFIDEFQHFDVQDIETIITEGRRFNCSVVLAHQSLVQLSPKLRSLILNNFGVKFAMRCGRDDATALCKNIAGDPNILDLNDLPPGEALMWVRGYAPEHVELNEPLGLPKSMTWQARELLQEVYDRYPHYEPDTSDWSEMEEDVIDVTPIFSEHEISELEISEIVPSIQPQRSLTRVPRILTSKKPKSLILTPESELPDKSTEDWLANY